MDQRLKVRSLSDPAFAAMGGTYANLCWPHRKPTGKSRRRGVRFYADLVGVNLGSAPDGTPNNVASISVCRVLPRNTTHDPLEFHEATGEGVFNFNASDDIVLLLAKAGTQDPPKREDVLAFRVPYGTFVSLPKGMWHWAPVSMAPDNNWPIYVMILLPPETYRKDCHVRKLNLGLWVRP
ncbi:MAG: hypothetical protein NTW11_00790 [Candidatus Staskawiczbacteria bacterium]|nr:hypothetical protein [Candidatus Staskawiczbacteria bacterium]